MLPEFPIPPILAGMNIRHAVMHRHSHLLRTVHSAHLPIVLWTLAALLLLSLPASGTQITSFSWNTDLGVMVVSLDSFPGWGGWRMWVNGIEVPMEGGSGQPVVRPNAPLDQNPTALLIGTTPWVSALPAGAMPCAGTLQFEIPGVGMTNAFAYDLTGSYCAGGATPQPSLPLPTPSGTSSGVGSVSGTLRQDTVWSGDVWVTGFVYVPQGVTLTIEPGTRVRFKHYRGYTSPGERITMRVEGTLKAVGTPDRPIWFTSDAADPMNGDWGMLRLVDAASDCEIRFAILEFAQQGLNLWNSSPALSDLIVRWNNWEGIYLESYCKPTQGTGSSLYFWCFSSPSSRQLCCPEAQWKRRMAVSCFPGIAVTRSSLEAPWNTTRTKSMR